MISPFIEELVITDNSITRKFGRKLGKKKTESVLWNEINKIEILTTNSGPLVEDFFILLHASAKGVCVSNALSTKEKLIEELQRRFPDLDNQAIINASSCIENQRFLIWEKKVIL